MLVSELITMLKKMPPTMLVKAIYDGDTAEADVTDVILDNGMVAICCD